jgi:hypothetical protein
MYMFTEQARDIAGNLLPMSDPVVVTTAPPYPNDHTPPTAPTQVTAENNVLILVLPLGHAGYARTINHRVFPIWGTQ